MAYKECILFFFPTGQETLKLGYPISYLPQMGNLALSCKITLP